MYVWRYLNNQYTEDPLIFVFINQSIARRLFWITGDTSERVLSGTRCLGLGWLWSWGHADLSGIFTTTMNLITACCLSSSHWSSAFKESKANGWRWIWAAEDFFTGGSNFLDIDGEWKAKLLNGLMISELPAVWGFDCRTWKLSILLAVTIFDIFRKF